jgi:hypothetical protein
MSVCGWMDSSGVYVLLKYCCHVKVTVAVWSIFDLTVLLEWVHKEWLFVGKTVVVE